MAVRRCSDAVLIGFLLGAVSWIRSTVRVGKRSQAHIRDSKCKALQLTVALRSKVTGELSGRGTNQFGGLMFPWLKPYIGVSPSLPGSATAASSSKPGSIRTCSSRTGPSR